MHDMSIVANSTIVMDGTLPSNFAQEVEMESFRSRLYIAHVSAFRCLHFSHSNQLLALVAVCCVVQNQRVPR